jgi:hypothetical protein
MCAYQQPVTDDRELRETGGFEKPKYRNIKCGVYYASNWFWRKPFPGKMAISKDCVMGWLKRLEVLVWLEDCPGAEGDEDADKKRETRRGQ